MDSKAGRNPPYQATTVIKGKKKMKGSAVGPMVEVRASLPKNPISTQIMAIAYRNPQGRAAGGVFGENRATISDRLLPIGSAEIPKIREQLYRRPPSRRKMNLAEIREARKF